MTREKKNRLFLRTHPENVVELLGHIETLITSTHTAKDLGNRGIPLLAVLHALFCCFVVEERKNKKCFV